MAQRTMGIDIGTTSVKAVVVDDDGEVVARARIPHPVFTPAPDRFEHDADKAWRRGPRAAWRQLASSNPAAVAVSSMVPSLAAVDAKGKPITHGLLYGDARGRDGVERREDSDAGEVAGFLRWLAREAPDAHGYWPAPAVANHALAGVGTIDIGTAFTSAPLFGPAGTWDPEQCEAAGARVGQLPAIGMLGSAIGTVTGSEAVLSGGCVDGMCEQIVAGADEPGDVLVICGTTLITWIVSDQPVTIGRLWSTPHTTPGRHVVGGPSNAGGLFLGWASRLTGPGHGARGVPDPANIPVWLPYVRGERTPLHDPNRRSSLHGLDLTHGPLALARAAYEAAGFVVRHHIEMATAVPGVEARRIVAVGGGTKVDGWMQALADATDLPVHVAADPEGAAKGAAFLARMALGAEKGFEGASRWARTGRIVEPDPVWRAGTRERYAVFKALTNEEHA